MKQYEHFRTADFVMDEYFRQWISNPTPEVEEFWDQWLKLHPHKKEEVFQAKKLFLAIDFKKTDVREIPEEAMLARIRTSVKGPSHTQPARAVQLFHWQKIAAIFVGVIALTATLIFILRHNNHDVNIKTAYGETEKIVLPDKSVVMLNANSKLRYRNDWEESKTREVWLEGEAFFEVTKSPGKGNARFVVHANQVNVEVLGTEFNVHNRRGATEVVLNSGKVRLVSESTVEKEITMLPGEVAKLENGQTKFTKKKVADPDVYSSWTDHKLIFSKTPFRDIVRLLEDNYGYRVEADVEGIEQVTFTATIPGAELEMLLQILAESYNVRITRTGKVISIVKE